jgi:hypothetical protein
VRPWKRIRCNRGPGTSTGEVASLRAALAQHLPDVISALVEAAKKGDTAAAKLILERTIPALRPEELPVSLDGVSGSRAQMVSAVIDAVTSGKLDTARGGRFIVALAPDVLEERIEKWERIVQEVNHE